MEGIYLDNAATTPLRPEALEAMLPFLHGAFANPSSPHSSGQRVRHAVDAARERCAAALGAKPSEIIFTGSGTEADNLAILGIVGADQRASGRLVTSAIEHHAVLHAAEHLRARGIDVAILPVDGEGFVSPDALRGALARGPALVSIMHANNEIGTVQQLRRLADVAHERGALFHTDAVQTVGHIPTNVDLLGVDALSLSAHKFEGPKGVGALYLREGVRLAPQIHGGGQEGGRRSGTENVAGIVGMSVALELAVRELPKEMPRLCALRDLLIETLTACIPDTALNGPRLERLPNNASLRFAGVDGASVVLQLDLQGIEVSTGSACASGSLEPSHVLTALGLDAAAARGTVRCSLGRTASKSDIERVCGVLPAAIGSLREVSGLFAR